MDGTTQTEKNTCRNVYQFDCELIVTAVLKYKSNIVFTV